MRQIDYFHLHIRTDFDVTTGRLQT